MSFIFNPHPYEDTTAVNHLENMPEVLSGCCFGYDAVAAKIAQLISENGIVCMDGNSAADFGRMVKNVSNCAAPKKIKYEAVCVDDIFKDSKTLHKELEYFLPENLEDDPAQIFGKIYNKPYHSLYDEAKLAELLKKLESAKKNGEKILLYGHGAASEDFQKLADKILFLDITNKVMFERIRGGAYTAMGDKEGLSTGLQFRRIYYIDFQIAVHLREQLIADDKLDYYLTSDHDYDTMIIEHKAMKKLLAELVKRPLRCRPFYAQGVWGGYYLMDARHLPREQFKNIAWSVDMNGMDQATVIQLDDKHQFVLPFLTIIEEYPDEILGPEIHKMAGKYFPIRFSYDDTFHSAGNMSIQCHPGDEFCKSHFNEFGRQDEGYYIVLAGHDAKTYLGLKNGVSVEQFMEKAKQSEKDHKQFDHDQYVNSVKSFPGRQFMIPGGTIHSSGRNQLVMEIGSQVMGSYTFKQYDYCRMDLNGTPRPIHTKYGEQVLNPERTADFVAERLVQEPRLINKGEGWEEYCVGEDPLVYYSCRQLKFADKAEGNTNGRFHVFVLVDGQKVTIRSKKNHEQCYHADYLDVVVVPADMGEYEVINDDPIKQPVVLYKVQVKENK